jgi:hypothetical protein
MNGKGLFIIIVILIIIIIAVAVMSNKKPGSSFIGPLMPDWWNNITSNGGNGFTGPLIPDWWNPTSDGYNDGSGDNMARYYRA